ncbi:hypothetical protein JX266_014060 [Neoarthrinium moseri]|nr:hypothetical protein JX266_014060 [Neoarthrinium moseri]
MVTVHRISFTDVNAQRPLASEHELARAYLSDRRISEVIGLLKHVVAIEAQLYDKDDPEREVSAGLLADAYRQLEACNENTASSSESSEDNNLERNKDGKIDKRASTGELLQAMSRLRI